MRIAKSKIGFSLVELLFVIGIIAVVAAIGIPTYTEATKNARDNKKKAEIETLRQAIVLHRANNPAGGYISPSSAAALPQDLQSAGFLSHPLPQAPTHYSTSANTFCVCATMENNNGNRSAENCSGSFDTSGAYYCARQP